MAARYSFRLLGLMLALAALLPAGGCVSSVLWAMRTATDLDWHGQDRIELPLVVADDGYVGVSVKLQGNDEVAYLDTGAAMPGISKALASAAGVKFKPGKDTQVAKDVAVQLGAASLKLPAVLLFDEMPKAEFVLGEELFSKAIVDMDFGAGRVAFIRPEAFTPQTDAPMSVKLRYSSPTVRINIGGHESCAIIDTGSGFGLMLNSDLVAQLALPGDQNLKNSYARADGTKYETAALLPLDEVLVGGKAVRNVPVMSLAPDEHLGDRGCNNLIGMKILTRNHVIFDMKNSRIWLLPR